MKKTSFFIEKTESFIKQLKAIELVESRYFTNTDDLKSENDKIFNEQKNELSEIEFQVKLMLTEFDNGTLFIETLDSSYEFSMFTNEPKKNRLLKTNQLFLDFLNEYRD